jgi:hypothetical protein
MIAKAECMIQGTNRRFLITNLPGDPQKLYDTIYTHRGEMENRIKELKNGLATDRLICHRFLANQFRLLLHTFASCLLWFLREHLATTPFSTPQADTLRLHFFKIGVRVMETTRHVWLHFASGYPRRELVQSGQGHTLATDLTRGTGVGPADEKAGKNPSNAWIVMPCRPFHRTMGRSTSIYKPHWVDRHGRMSLLAGINDDEK